MTDDRTIRPRAWATLLTGLLALAIPAAAGADTSLFCGTDGPIFGDRFVEVSGGGAIHGSDGMPSLVRTNGKFVASGGSMVESDVIAGGEVKRSGGSIVTGSIIEDVDTRVVPASAHALVAAYEFDNDNHTIPLTGEGEQPVDGFELEVKGGDSLEMAAGDYYFTEFKFTGGSTLHVTGDVRIYMPEGKFEFSGGGLAAKATGASLMVIMADRGEVKSTGGSDFYGAVYAPHAKVVVSGDGNSYGGVVAREFKLTGGSELFAHDVCAQGPPEIEPDPIDESDPNCDWVDGPGTQWVCDDPAI